MTSPLFQVEKLSAGYGQTQILQDVSFTIEQGEIVSIVGESGSGKSTLFNAILGIEDDLKKPEGEIYYQGKVLNYKEVLGKEIGAVYQSASYSLVDTRRIARQFEETVLAHKKMSKEEIKERALAILSNLHFDNPEKVYRSYPFELSGGMRQRVSLALALILSPSLLICDEPTSALDVHVENEIIGLFEDLRNKQNISILLITHNLHLAQYISDKILVFYGGRIVEQSRPGELKEKEHHPYTQDLLGAVPQFLGGLPRPIDGQPPKFPLGKGCVYLDRCKLKKPACAQWVMTSYGIKGGQVACLQVKNLYSK